MTDRTCPIEEPDGRCPNPLYGNTGMCNKHYQRTRRLGTPHLAQMPPPEARNAPGLPGERWLPVPFPGFDGYEVSDFGRVRSWKVYRGKPGPRILTGGLTDKGYPMVGLTGDDGKLWSYTVYRLVVVAFVGTRPDDAEEIRHLDGDKLNSALTNLTYGTTSENAFDSVAHGTHPMARKTHCKHEHEFTPENTYRKGNGGRGCKECRRINDRARRRRIKQAKLGDAA